MYVVWDFFNPAYTCPWDIERIGHLGDGGKWVCGLSKYIEFSEMAEQRQQQQQQPPPPPRTKDLSKKADQDDGELDDGEHAANLVVYSFGVNDDSSFEEVMLAETNAEVVAVDYTVNSVCPFFLFPPFPLPPHSSSPTSIHPSIQHRAPPTQLTHLNQFGKELLPSHRNRSTFLKVGLGDADEPHHREAPFYTLSTIMRKRKHAYIDYLKIDIEGAEWASLGRFMDDCDDGIAGRTDAAAATTRKGKGKGKGTGKKKMGLKEAAVSTAMERRSLDQLQQETTTREDAVFLGQIDDDDDDEEEEEEEEGGVKMGGSRMPVGQLSMELHIDNELTFNFEDLIAFIDRLEGFGMRCVFFEVNYWGANSHPPRFVEMVWVNVNDPRNVLWHE